MPTCTLRALPSVFSLGRETGWPWTGDAGPAPFTAADSHRWPRISVVTPSLNQCAFIEAALRSVLLQGYPNLELIVVDGGSTDGSIDTIARYREWLTHLICEPDSGPAHALNKGFKLATGEIFAVLNADDFYLSGGMAKIAQEFLRFPSADVVSGHGYLAEPSGKLGAPLFSDRWHAGRFAHGACVLVQPATFFRRNVFEKVGGFNQANRTTWDLELWADMARAGASFRSVEGFVAAFRLHRESITANRQLRERRLEDTRTILERFRGRRERPQDRLYRFLHRARKFCGHPTRTLSQRAFVYSTLRRWSLE
jgi:glycosyltransferase involved in cell wall biosynthesis